MKIYLRVPYVEKDEAKRLGAKWDIARRTWFVENAENLAPFLKWMPEHMTRPHEREKPAVADERTSAPPPSRRRSEPFDFDKVWNELDSRKTPGKPAKKAKRKDRASNPSATPRKASPPASERSSGGGAFDPFGSLRATNKKTRKGP